MSRSVLHFLTGICMLLATVLPAAAQDSQVAVPLTSRDEFVVRSMQVKNKAGEIIPGLMTIESYDAVSMVFTFDDVSGAKKKFKASDLKQIAFSQDVVQQQSFAQEPAWKIKVVQGEEKRLKVAEKDLRIKAGILYLNKKDLGALAQQGTIEVLHINPKPDKKWFSVLVENVQYTKTYLGGGGPSGVRKGL